MNKRLLKIFNTNLTDITISDNDQNFKEGTFFEDIKELHNDIRYKYIKNLISLQPLKIDIPESADLIEKYLILFFSFNDTTYQIEDQLLEHDFIGVLSENSDIPILFVNLKEESKIYSFSARNINFNFKVSSLNLEEQVKLSIHMINSYRTEKNTYTRNTQVLAYLD